MNGPTGESSPTPKLSSDESSPSRIGRLFAGLRIVSLCTLLSRVLGLAREMAMAALFGNGRVLDAFTVAFAIPNLARSLFGEGALSTAFLPLLVREKERHGQEAANRLATAVFAWVVLGLSAVVAAVEILLAGVLWLLPLSSEWRLWFTLTAVMLPYLPLICLTAQIGAVLNAAGRFAWPALLPVFFNLCSLAAIAWVQRQDWMAESQALGLAFFVVATGAVQVVVPWPQLLRVGFRFDRRWREAKDRVRELAQVMIPIVLGLSITQLNTVCDRMIAFGFSRPETVAALLDDERIETTNTDWRPLEAGTASALNQGQRLYQFPLGLLGVALGTVIFPLLTRHAERGELQALRDDLSLGLRLVMVIGLPASAGLWLLSDVLSVVIFQRGQFSPADARQTSEMIAAYGVGVWAFCGLLIVQRGFYAIGDRRTPLRIGMLVMCVNLALNLSLIWKLGGQSLALSTSLCGVLQFGLCLQKIQKPLGRLPWKSLVSNATRAGLASAAMLGVGWWTLRVSSVGASTPKLQLMPLLVTLLASVSAYALLAFALRLDEFWMLLRQPPKREILGGLSDPD